LKLVTSLVVCGCLPVLSGCSLLFSLDQFANACAGGCSDGTAPADSSVVDVPDVGLAAEPADASAYDGGQDAFGSMSDDSVSAFQGAGDAPADAPDSSDGASEHDADAEPVDDATPDTGPAESGATDSPATCASQPIAAKMATTSSVYPLGTPDEGAAGLAIDGVLDTCWESAWMVDPQWLDVDFGAPVFVSEVDILWQACATNYTIELSNDEMTWTTIATVMGNVTVNRNAPADWSGAAVHKGLSGKGRYLRISGTVRCDAPNYGYAIWEVRAFGSPTCQP
jgi:hypothetical protein